MNPFSAPRLAALALSAASTAGLAKAKTSKETSSSPQKPTKETHVCAKVSTAAQKVKNVAGAVPIKVASMFAAYAIGQVSRLLIESLPLGHRLWACAYQAIAYGSRDVPTIDFAKLPECFTHSIAVVERWLLRDLGVHRLSTCVLRNKLVKSFYDPTTGARLPTAVSCAPIRRHRSLTFYRTLSTSTRPCLTTFKAKVQEREATIAAEESQYSTPKPTPPDYKHDLHVWTSAEVSEFCVAQVVKDIPAEFCDRCAAEKYAEMVLVGLDALEPVTGNELVRKVQVSRILVAFKTTNGAMSIRASRPTARRCAETTNPMTCNSLLAIPRILRRVPAQAPPHGLVAQHMSDRL
ncbi:hypothetical protein BCR44DRAFT_1500536 [Catenaria anguillulae PL171]|uniref:Uncharacterized protein n=1 Tax=Catenaria anguillulae PL171 TaxID=765915 RepID=A0A1Y2HIA4_9FUNG|nr:hypothetical protein BCR44DRAFT_1500536 [Catenaria anguillulae PL171]